MSQDDVARIQIAQREPTDTLARGIVDLYARRMSAVTERQAADRQAALDRMVVTQPFGRAFTAQPSYPPDPAERNSPLPGGLAGLRRKLAGGSAPPRKLATS